MMGSRFEPRPIATPRSLKNRNAHSLKPKKRKSGDGVAPLNMEEQEPALHKKVKAESNEGKDWDLITKQHTSLLTEHQKFLSTLLAQSTNTTRTTALLSFVGRTNEMLSQVSTLGSLPGMYGQAMPPPHQRSESTTTPAVQSIELTPGKRKRSPTTKSPPTSREPSSASIPDLRPSTSETPAFLDGTDEREGSPQKKLRPAPSVAEVMRRTAASSLERKMSIRLAGSAKFTSAAISRSRASVNAAGEVVVESEDISEEVERRMREKRRKRERIVEHEDTVVGEGGEKRVKRRRRSSTIEREGGGKRLRRDIGGSESRRSSGSGGSRPGSRGEDRGRRI